MSDQEFEPSTMRVRTEIGTDLLIAECLHYGCGWTMRFAFGASTLDQVTEVCSQHPCRRAPTPSAELARWRRGFARAGKYWDELADRGDDPQADAVNEALRRIKAVVDGTDVNA